MKVLTIRLPLVKTHPADRPKECPHCASRYLHRHGSFPKPVKDHQIKQVIVCRYRCVHCRRTFRHYPEGVGRPDQSARLIILAAVAWALGLSTRATAWLFTHCGARISKSTVFRDVRAVSERLQDQVRRSRAMVPVLGLDGTGSTIKGQEASIVIAVDVGTGQPLSIARISEHDLEGLVAWLKPLVKAYGVEVLVTDELPTDNLVAEAFGLKHGHCRFHLKRRVGRLFRAFETELGDGVKPLLAEVRQIIEELPPEGGKKLLNLALRMDARFDPRKKVQSPLYRLKQCLLRLSEHWPRYRLWLGEPRVPSTNNATEQAICRLKLRARTVRGFKTFAGVEAVLLLTCAQVV
jgi:transposase-like protein